MNRLKRFYDQNTKLVWSIIGIIVAIIVALQIINNITKKKLAKRQEEINDVNYISTNNSINTTNYNDISLQSQESVLSGNKISSSKQGEIDTINEFFKYLNEKEIENAYNLLTEECKEELYSSVDDFNEYYYKQILNESNKNITVENWSGDIYRVKINDDILSLGKYSTQNTIQDYITVQENNNEYKLNINSYIGRRYLDRESEQKDIIIKTLQKDAYMDYTEYTFEVINNSFRPIVLDGLEYLDSLYLEDDNNVKYSCYTHEMSLERLKVNPEDKKTVRIKFFNKYSSSKKITKAVFSKLVLDYDAYASIVNKKNYDNYYRFEVEV